MSVIENSLRDLKAEGEWIESDSEEGTISRDMQRLRHWGHNEKQKNLLTKELQDNAPKNKGKIKKPKRKRKKNPRGRLSRPWINDARAVSSTLHRKIKFVVGYKLTMVLAKDYTQISEPSTTS
ncbi:unnamed protein product [Sphenostylis stenocarpa]|uniref:Uncharacterized protein n=1 Tax=Sphenostylis stenocarpa TaxID=92480 RepID=A0AA86VTW1_9FABA|nr:unnamed protein product [Sphenostylis stenocarpa]